MNSVTLKKHFFFLACQLLSVSFCSSVSGQAVQYSSENVYTNNPDNVHLVPNIAGNHHLLCFTGDEDPVIFIFNQELKFQVKKTIPFKLPERSGVRVIAFNNYYYLHIYLQSGKGHSLWKIDRKGDFANVSVSFQNLLQSLGLKQGFQLVANQEKLWLLYHIPLAVPQKNTVIIVQTDSLLNMEFTHKVLYDFNSDGELLQQEALLFGKYLLVLKTAQSGRLLELMKVNLATGHTFTKSFQSSGYVYSRPAFNYNDMDSTVTLSSLLTAPGTKYLPARYIFLSRLNKNLMEEIPFVILKSQFKKNATTNFLLAEGLSKWMRIREQAVLPFQDFSIGNPDNPAIPGGSREIYAANSGDGIRFSLLNKKFKIISDSLVDNKKNSYTLKANDYASFGFEQKEYLLLGQQFSKGNKGLLMIHTNERHQLVYTDVRVHDRNDYLLSKSRVIPQKGILIPYTNKKESGLIKVTVE